RRYRGGESAERRHRDPEKESRREKERLRERESTGRERRDEGTRDRRKEGSQDRRAERGNEREKTRERERFVDVRKYGDDYRENKEKRRDLEEKHDRERDKERHRDMEKERVRDRDRHREEDRSKRRDDVNKERKREEEDRELRNDGDRRRHKESREGRGAQIEQHHREEKDQHRERERHQNEYEDTRNAKEERQRDMKHLEQKEDRGKHTGAQRERTSCKEHRGEEIRHHRADRELAERDKPKDRRYKEGEDPDNKHRERRHKHEADVERKHKERKHREEDDHRDKRSSSGKSHERNVVSLRVNFPHSSHNDYEEDFEELNESTNEDEDEKEPLHPQAGEAKEELSAQRRKEIEAIRRAMDEENERIGTTKSRQSTSREEEERPKWSRDTEKIQSRASQRGKFIDFIAAKQREVSKKVASKQKKRSTELLRLIDLDFSMTFSLLDLPPVNEYDMYIRNFGNANTKQAYVQCNEDNTDRDIQTEEIEMSEKWTQHPPERSGACGDPNLSKEARDKQRSEMNYDSQRLASFLRSASQVMVVLLEEDQAERKSLEKLSTQSDTLSFSDGSLQLITELPFLYDRQISMLHFSQVQKRTMLSVHMPTTKPSAKHLDSCTIICIWNIWEPSRPQKILVYESEIQCCCFSPGKLSFRKTGSLLHFKNITTKCGFLEARHTEMESVLRLLHSTVYLIKWCSFPIVESSGLSFQLASLDESGVLNFWVVVELPKGNEAGSPTDLGLRPGGKVKLLHSSSVIAAERGSPRDVVKTGPLHTLLLKFLPTDSNHFFIGTNMGLVHHGTSHGLKAPPKFYRFQEVEVQPVDVTSIHFSPFRPHLFLVRHTMVRESPPCRWMSTTCSYLPSQVFTNAMPF
uniref:Dynein 2 intermediate chain 1 n=1 Tax=Neolamprologus brichardi TaxID=32507 RepID=A0A3Q4HCU9_NEOBR